MISLLRQLGDSPISKVESVEYHITLEKEFTEKFKYYKSKGVFVNNRFEDKVWVAITGVEKTRINFTMNEIQFKSAKNTGKFSSDFVFKDLEISLKGFVLYQLDIYATGTLKQFIDSFRRMLNEGILMQNDIPESSITMIMKSCRLLKEYFMFVDPYYSNEDLVEDMELKYFDFMVTHHRDSKDGKGKRALPTIETMFRFNDIINDFINITKVRDPIVSDDEQVKQKAEENRRKREKFFPIILWWKITSILPMRTQEFTVIPRNCLPKKYDKPYLKFYRNDIKGKNKMRFNHSFEACFREEEFPINEEVKALIQEYQDLVQYYDDMEDFYENGRKGAIEREFLLSYRSYKVNSNGKWKNFFVDDLEFFSKSNLRYLLNTFLNEYVVGELGLTIVLKSKEFTEKDLLADELNDICLMDTRHYAIMNMVFLGYEAATVQRIVGHKTLDMSLTYYSHPEQFIRGYTISAAKQDALKKNSDRKNIIFRMVFDDLFGKEGSGNERYRRFKAKLNAGNINEKKLSIGGVCIYNGDDMLPCKLLGGNHKRCRYYDGGKTMTQEIEKEFDSITDEISAELQTLKYLMKHEKTLTGFKEQYNVSWNKIRSKALIQAGMISDYIICGIESEE